MTSSGFGNNMFDRFKNFVKPVIVVFIGSKSVSSHRNKIESRATTINIRREVRRKELRNEIKTLEKDSTLTPGEKEANKENAALEFTLSSLDDDQPKDNVLQDLALAKVFPSETESVSITVERELHMGKVPTWVMPAKRHDFSIQVTDKNGVERTINNPLKSLALPVETVSSSTGVRSSSPPDSFASITSALLRKDKEVSVTILNLKTNQIQTFNNSKALQTAKNNQNEILQEEGENLRKEEGESFQNEIFQGVNPNSNLVRLNPQQSTATSAITTMLFIFQLVIVYSFIMPLVDSLQIFFKNKVLNKFFKKDTKDNIKSDED